MNKISNYITNLIATFPLVAMVVYCLYQLLYLNIEGNGKIATVVALMLSWGLLFCGWFVRFLKVRTKDAEV